MIMNVKQFNYYIDLMRRGDCLGVQKIQYEYLYPIKYTALKNVDDLEIADDAISSVMAYITHNSRKLGYIEKPGEFIYTVTDKITKNYKHTPGNKPIKYISDKEKQLALRFSQLPENEQETFLLFSCYLMEDGEISKFLNRPAEVITAEINSAAQKLDDLAEMFEK